jgi:hypothetical protein
MKVLVKPSKQDFTNNDDYTKALEDYISYLEDKDLFSQGGVPIGEGETETHYQARIAICEPAVVGDGKFHQFRFAGALVCPTGQPLLCDTKDWENIQCEISVRPIKRLGTAKHKNMHLGQVVTSLGDLHQWIKG